MPVVMGLGGAVGLVQGALYFLGGRIDSFKKESDEFERKERLRRTTRLPVEQTVAEIGEGRGTFCGPLYVPGPMNHELSQSVAYVIAILITPPLLFFLSSSPLFAFLFFANVSVLSIGITPAGYEERRRQRIQEKYGFEINPVNATVEGSQ